MSMIAEYSTLTKDKESVENHSEIYTAQLIAALEEADASIDRGEFITLEELEKEYYSWTFK